MGGWWVPSTALFPTAGHAFPLLVPSRIVVLPLGGKGWGEGVGKVSKGWQRRIPGPGRMDNGLFLRPGWPAPQMFGLIKDTCGPDRRGGFFLMHQKSSKGIQKHTHSGQPKQTMGLTEGRGATGKKGWGGEGHIEILPLLCLTPRFPGCGVPRGVR